MSDFVYQEPKMAPETVEMRQESAHNQALLTLEGICRREIARNVTGEPIKVEIARRVFNEDRDYKIEFDKYSVLIVRARLNVEGIETDLKMVMDSEKSRKILVIYPPAVIASRHVHGELKK